MANSKAVQYMATIDITKRQYGMTIVIGVVVGILTWLLSLLLQTVLIEPLFCQSADSFGACANGGTISITIALIIAHTLGLFALVRVGAYRPLLVILAALVTLFGVHAWLGAMSWYEATFWYALLSGLAYGLYAWLARLASFGVSLAAMIVVIIVLRLLMAQL